MDRRKDSWQVQRLEVVELGRRRRWTEEAKRRIVEESFVGRRQASATARRYGISTSLLFSWRKAYREGPFDATGFVPALVIDDAPPAAPPQPTRIEIVTPNGHRVLVESGVDERTLARVLAVVARA